MSRFKPGQSGNPGGRPKENHEVRQLARRYTTEAIERLAYWLKSDNAKASVSAAQALLDRGYGRPAQPLGNDPENPLIAAGIDLAQLKATERDALRRLLERAIARSGS